MVMRYIFLTIISCISFMYFIQFFQSKGMNYRYPIRNIIYIIKKKEYKKLLKVERCENVSIYTKVISISAKR